MGIRPAAALLLAAAMLQGSAAAYDEATAAELRGGDLVSVRSAVLTTRGVLSLSAGGSYYESLDLVDELDGVDAAAAYLDLHLAGAYGLATWLEMDFDVPFRRASWDGTAGGSGRVSGVDNPVVGLKLAAPLGYSSFSLALSVRTQIPVGSELMAKSVSRDADGAYLSGGATTDAELALLATADLTRTFPLRVHANVGWAFRREDDRGRRFYPDYYPAVPDGGGSFDNDAVILRGAVEFPGRAVTLFSEFRGDMTWDRELVPLKENPMTVTPGVRFALGRGWSATAAMTVAISGDDRDTPDFDPHESYPDWAATFALSYSRPISAADTDSDGIPDFRDDCPRRPEDVDGFEDADGCPDPDNDSDGVPDTFDASPNLAEDLDGFEDEDGVPDLDNDGDGIVDERDMCPDEREDLDGFEDEDGCPDE